MNSIPLDVAFLRLGAVVAGRRRPQWATARDGSLVLVCQVTGFSHPGPGVLRYSAQLSSSSAPPAQIAALRESMGAALAGATPVRLIIQTPAVEGASSRIHVRDDLVGSVAAFDGDAYSVDFVRPQVDPVPEKRGRRKRSSA